jgi:urease accessory protein
MHLADPVEIHSWRAELSLAFERRGGRTVLAQRRHEGPLVGQKPLYPEGDAVCHAILVHPPGGIAGGDELVFRTHGGAGTHVLLTTPAATKWYRSLGAWAKQCTRIEAGSSACVEWLPQESIVFNAARASISLDVDLAADAVFIGWDILCFGRTGAGESFSQGECRLHSCIRRERRPVWFERGVLRAGDRLCTSPAGLHGRSVCGTLVAAAPGIDRALLAACRGERVGASDVAAVTQTPDVLVVRYLGHSSAAAREYFQRIWRLVRPALAARPAQTPRIWNT